MNLSMISWMQDGRHLGALDLRDGVKACSGLDPDGADDGGHVRLPGAVPVKSRNTGRGSDVWRP
jgi:hypothetical protein